MGVPSWEWTRDAGGLVSLCRDVVGRGEKLEGGVRLGGGTRCWGAGVFVQRHGREGREVWGAPHTSASSGCGMGRSPSGVGGGGEHPTAW